MVETSLWLPERGVHLRDLGPRDSSEVLLHVHGFAISGSYLMPTARALGDTYRSVVPDLPGFGKSPRPPQRLDFAGMADVLVGVMDDLHIEKATLVGNSMGCPVICEFDHRHHDRLSRAVLVSPAGGEHSRPMSRALSQLARDAFLESPSMARVAVPDYVRFGPLPALRLFGAMTRYPSVERLLELSVPALAVLGSRDPLLPGPERARFLMQHARSDLDVAVILGAAHAINFSHPEDLAWLIRAWLEEGYASEIPAPASVRVLDVRAG